MEIRRKWVIDKDKIFTENWRTENFIGLFKILIGFEIYFL